MPRIVYTVSDDARIEEILEELNPGAHPLTLPFKTLLPGDDWRFVVTYAREEMRSALEIGMLARAVADAARRRHSSNEEGVSTFLNSVSWMRNFGVSDGADERFRTLADVDSPLFLAVDGLLQMAQDRLFNTLDEEFARLVDES